MSTHPLTSPTLTAPRRPAHLRAAAVAFSLVWLLGLAIPLPTVELDAPARAVLDTVVGHEAATALRSLLIHGLAAVALLTVAIGLARAATGAGQRGLARAAKVSGAVAAALSLVQCVLELILAGPVAGARDAGTADALVDAVNRLDGMKMLALAALVFAGVVAVRRAAVLPRWLGMIGAVLVLALGISAVGYVLLASALAPAAFAALPLLLIWITATGLALARRARR